MFDLSLVFLNPYFFFTPVRFSVEFNTQQKGHLLVRSWLSSQAVQQVTEYWTQVAFEALSGSHVSSFVAE